TAKERHLGFVEGLREHGIEVDESLVQLDVRGIEKADVAARQLLTSSRPPTALITGQNLVTIGAFRALRRQRLHRKIALVGFDDFPLADLLDPGVTVIAQDPAAIGRTAAGIVFRRLDGDTAPFQTHIVRTLMIKRGSGEIQP
ncbi:MAG: LacI family transcriptional regulator, partial [Chloroflexi bacterium]